MNDFTNTQFDEFPSNYQYRPHLCKEYFRLFSQQSDLELLILEARPGIGATSFSAEYFKSLNEPAILLTIQAGSRAGYSVQFVLEQAIHQAYEILKIEPSKISDEVNQNYASIEWNSLLGKLRRLVKAKHTKLHIIVDGLYQIPVDDDRYLQEVIRDVLALGIKEIKHVITWREGVSIPKNLLRCKNRVLLIPTLSDHESKSLLTSSGINDGNLEKILAEISGVPALLNSAIRLNNAGKLNPDNLHTELASYYREEWKSLKDSFLKFSDNIDKLFAYIVFSKKPISIEELSEYINLEVSQIREIIESSGFVKITPQSLLIFNSNSYREFIKSELKDLRIKVLNEFVSRLTNDPKSSDSIQLLPNYFEEMGRYQDIISVLTPENMDIFLKQTQSLKSLRIRSELGFKAAETSKQLIEIYRFGLQTSIVRTLEGSSSDEALLAAYTSTDKLELALSLAQNQQTKESKILLYSQYVKFLFLKGIKVDDVLSETIKSLISEIDFRDYKERALEIAENLVGPFPELGIALVEQCSDGAKQFQDIAFTQLALKTSFLGNEELSKRSEKYSSKISDSKLQGFLHAAQSVTRDKSAEAIKRSTITLDGRQRYLLLTSWIVNHTKDTELLDVVDFALDEVARDPTYLPTASDLRVLCYAINNSKGEDSLVASLLERINTQRLTLVDFAPSIDKFRLDIEIAKTKTYLKIENHENVLTDLYVRASDMPVITTKLECFCWLYSSLYEFLDIPQDTKQEFERLCNEAVNESFTKALTMTAEHKEIFQSTISGLICYKPEILLKMISKLNTEKRRDTSYSIFIERYIQSKDKLTLKVELIINAISSIANIQDKREAIVKCLRLLDNLCPKLDSSPEPIVKMGIQIDDPLGRAYAWRWIVGISKNYNLGISLEYISNQFSIACSEIDPNWKIPELSYWMIESYAKINQDFAIDELNKLEKTIRLDRTISPVYGNLHSNLVRLSSISFSGLLQSKNDFSDEFDSLIQLIEHIPSIIRKLEIYADLAIRAYLKSVDDLFKKIVENKIQGLIKNFNGNNQIKQTLIEIAYTPLFLWNQSYAESLIEDFPNTIKDDCYGEIINLLITNTPISEPNQDDQNTNCKLTYPDSIKIVDLIEKLSTDSILASFIESFCFAATSSKSRLELSKHQRVNLSNKLIIKCDNSLPDAKNILHEGWKIYIKASINLLIDEDDNSNWNSLINDAKKIPNLSDSIFVLSHIAKQLPKKLSSTKKSLISDIETMLPQLPSLSDRVARAVFLSNTITSNEHEKIITKRLLTNAMKETILDKEAKNISDIQKDIIDAAYQFDKEFVNELMALIDDDPARAKAKHELQQRIDHHKEKNAILEKKNTSNSMNNVSQIGWEMLGALNASKVAAPSQEDISKYLNTSYKRDLSDAYGFYWWYLRALQDKYGNHQGHTESILVPLFEVTRLSTLLVENISQRISGRTSISLDSIPSTKSTGIITGPGSRDEAMEYIKNWLEKIESTDVLICDPYFRPENLNFVKELYFHKNGLSFCIISCDNGVVLNGDLNSEYELNWSKLSYTQPPELRAIHIGFDGQKNKNPIHDRWLICGNSALRFGTSFSSFGVSKLSEISTVDESDVQNIRNALEPFINMTERWLEGKRLKYNVVQW